MDNLEQTTNDMIDSRIDKRLSSFQDSLELRLTKTIDAQLKSRFETAVKVLGWSFGLVALVFTLFGIKTAIDLREAAKSTAIEEVKKKLAIDDPTSEFRMDVDRVIARGLINSYFLELSRNKGNEFLRDVNISDTDLRRLVDLAKDPRSDDRDFRDAVDILSRSSQMKEGSYVGRILLGLGTASDDQYRWMREQTEKRTILFELFTGDKLVSTARSILADDKTDKRLLIATIKYVAKSLDYESIRTLEKLASRPDENISEAAIHALARLAPDSKAVATSLQLKPDASADAMAAALRLATDVARPRSRGFFDDDPKSALRLKLSSSLVAEAIKRGYVFKLLSDISSNKMGLAVSSRENPSTSYGIPARLIAGQEAEVFSHLLQRSTGVADTKAILRALCLEDEERCNGVVHATLDKKAAIRLTSGAAIGVKDAPAGVHLQARSPSSTAEIVVSWTDPDAIRKTLVLDQLTDTKDMRFEFRSIRALSSEGDYEE